MKKIFFFIFFTFFLFCTQIDFATALTLTPARQTTIIDPGQSQLLKITVKNDEKESVFVHGTVEGFGIEERTKRAIFGIFDPAVSWITVNPKQITIEPGQTKDIFFTLSVPQNTPPQVHYLAFFAEVRSTGGQVGISSRVGSLVFLYVSGNVREEMNIVDFSAGSSWYTKPDASIFLQTKNQGTIHTIPQGVVRAHDWRGNTLAEFHLNKENHLVLPSSEWAESYVFQLKPWHIGKIDLTLQLNYGLEQKMLLRKAEFWYIPIWSVGVVFAVFFLLLIVSIRIGMKKRK